MMKNWDWYWSQSILTRLEEKSDKICIEKCFNQSESEGKVEAKKLQINETKKVKK